MRMEQQVEQGLAQRAIGELREILLLRDIHVTELLIGAMALGWGVWLGNPAWDTFGSSVTYSAMASVAPEWLWAIAMTAVAVLQISGLLLDIYQQRRAAAIIGVALWGFIGVAFAAGNLTSTASIVYPLVAVADMWCYWRLKAGRL